MIDLDGALGAHDTIRAIGGNDIKRIAEGDWFNLWREKTGRADREDLTWNLPVAIGTALEPVIRRFYAHQTGRRVLTSERDLSNTLLLPTFTGADGRVSVRHPDIPWAIASIDGLGTYASPAADDGQDRLFEAKTCSYWLATKNRATLIEKHTPQCQWYMGVTGVWTLDLAFPVDNQKIEIVTLTYDDRYFHQLLGQAERFWWHIHNDVAPDTGAPAVPAPKAPFLGERIEDMTGNNQWGDAAARWLTNRDAVDAFDKAVMDLGKLMPEEAKIATGHGVRLTRNKRGAITIKREDDV